MYYSSGGLFLLSVRRGTRDVQVRPGSKPPPRSALEYRVAGLRGAAPVASRRPCRLRALVRAGRERQGPLRTSTRAAVSQAGTGPYADATRSGTDRRYAVRAGRGILTRRLGPGRGSRAADLALASQRRAVWAAGHPERIRRQRRDAVERASTTGGRRGALLRAASIRGNAVPARQATAARARPHPVSPCGADSRFPLESASRESGLRSHYRRDSVNGIFSIIMTNIVVYRRLSHRRLGA